MEQENETKKIVLFENVKEKHEKSEKNKIKNINTSKEKTKRVIVDSDKWTFTENDLNFDNMIQVLNMIQKKEFENPVYTNIVKCIIQQLNQKINGYKSQDIHKKLLDLEKLVDLENVLQLLIQSNLECFYCKNKVKVLYEHVREPSQWTLDRIDNDYGHNKGNLEIACLSCNVRRRTMYADRYVFTKQLKLIKKDG
jgi:hypothetical protein